MAEITIYGRQGPLAGAVTLSGAKNSALKVLAAAPLVQGPVILDNMPLGTLDVQIKVNMLRALGADITVLSEHSVRIDWPEGTPLTEVPDSYGRVRTSLLLLGSLAARCGRARVPKPGGCNLGDRKYDLHIEALGQLGIRCKEDGGFLVAENTGLRAANIEFPLRTTGGTENVLLAACLAPGTTRICNAHTRPEVDDLMRLLNTMGARTCKLGSGLIEINGVGELGGGYHSIIDDRMEALTYLTFAVVTRGKVLIRHFPGHLLEVPLIFLRESGVVLEPTEDGMMVDGSGLITPFDFTATTYPGIDSDAQPLFAAMATQAHGTSHITDNRFSHRFRYAEELLELGADITIDRDTAVIRGPTRLHGAWLRATDLRGGAALVAAGLIADGETVIGNAKRIMRGYEHLEEKLASLGATVEYRNREKTLAHVV